jgi:regulator of replication initiation timing
MAHVAKYTKTAVGHMLNHYARREEKSDYRSNESIDPDKTDLNYNLASDLQPMKQLDFMHKRLSEVKVQNRKDVNVLCDWIVTVPKDLPEEEHRPFFEETYKFLVNRYGSANTVSAWVHMDETTPHMHFAFIPVKHGFKTDKKNPEVLKEYNKVSAKEVLTRNDLVSFHSDLQAYIEHMLGHSVGILNAATIEGNRSIKELKRESAIERLQEATEKASKIVSKAQIQAQGINDSLIAVKAEYEAKKAYVREADKISNISLMYPSEAIVTEKGLFNKKKYVTVPVDIWEAKHVSANEKGYLQKANEALEANLQEFRNTSSSKNISSLSQHCKELEDRNSSLSIENQKLKAKLKKANSETEDILKKVNRVLSKLSESTVESFVNGWKEDNKNTHQSHVHIRE